MFGMGKDKDELRENMEEIKHLIEQGESSQSQERSQQGQQQTEKDSVRQPEREIEQEKPQFGGRTEEQNSEKPVVDSEIPDPPESRDLNVPEYDKGPLFIRREKFRRAANLVQDMRYLVQEINKSAGSLEQTIQEEEKIQQDMAALLGELEQERTEVRDFVSPGD